MNHTRTGRSPCGCNAQSCCARAICSRVKSPLMAMLTALSRSTSRGRFACRLSLSSSPASSGFPSRNRFAIPSNYQWSSCFLLIAGSCDFKARDLTPDARHDAYDLARCFGIGRDAGFRGPWCIEHFHTDLGELYREMRLLRDQLRAWMAARK